MSNLQNSPNPSVITNIIRTLTNSTTIPENKKHLVPTSGTYPNGFKVAGVHCGVKKNGQKDLALIVSDKPCTAAAVFTTNVFKAAPVLLSREILNKNSGQDIRAIVINSGCANAVTGIKGMENAKKMSDEVSKLTNVETSTLVMSTGVIGQHLPIEKIINGINVAHEKAVNGSHEGWMEVAETIMTTDIFPKLRSGQFTLPSSGLTYSMAGIAKGAGMIHPNMATLLATIVTDAPISTPALNEALKYAANRSFNSISVDGDMSTNDTFAILANGAAAATKETIIDDVQGQDFLRFRDDLTNFATDLAKLIVRDGEGATKFVTIHGVPTFDEAKKVASTIATSALVKTALFGQDANWGRILCAVGYSGVSSIIPNKVSVSFIPIDGSAPLKLLTLGEPENVDEVRALEILKMEELEIRVELGIGNEEAKMWTCDFSYDYVKINADYRT
ncbi:10415_t:CDS:2 [Diversispora eburnea]|uniref:Arginine biosynthesis bifunctional protein ArgJ, mitochondrial n=1 Tax=Diversispora eburnea TaxID=1213867 RepID=A0A9N8YK36_9GLOM|nr:10415_t:CDS:2 [Diversispora eburnea]